MVWLYSIWGGLVIGVVAEASLLNHYRPAQLVAAVPSYWLFVLIGVSIVLAMLALLYKFVFQQEVLSWFTTAVIAAGGAVASFGYGWNPWWFCFMAVAFIWLFVLAPILHFD